VRSNGVSCQRRRTFEVHDVDLSGSPPVMPPLGGFARVISFFKTFAEVFLDAQRDAAAAHKRYPYTDW